METISPTQALVAAELSLPLELNASRLPESSKNTQKGRKKKKRICDIVVLNNCW